MAIHLVPDDDAIKEETYARMSPRYVNVYKKNNSNFREIWCKCNFFYNYKLVFNNSAWEFGETVIEL